MGYAMRMAVYVVGGGALLAWIQPRHGLVEIAAVLALIGACAAADAVLEGARGRRQRGAPARKARSSARRAATRSGEGRPPQPLFVTADLKEAEALAAQLRDRALHPLLVTRRGVREDDPVYFEVRLPEPERLRGGPIVSRFSARAAGR